MRFLNVRTIPLEDRFSRSLPGLTISDVLGIGDEIQAPDSLRTSYSCLLSLTGYSSKSCPYKDDASMMFGVRELLMYDDQIVECTVFG